MKKKSWRDQSTTIKTLTKRLCYHEAGHAVVHLEIGDDVHSIDILPADGGWCHLFDTEEVNRKLDAVGTLAGGVADYRFCKGKLPRFFISFLFLRGVSGDLEEVSRENNWKETQDAFREAKRIVEDKWDKIQRLAEYTYKKVENHFNEVLTLSGEFVSINQEEIMSLL